MSARNNHIEKTPFSWADPLGFEDALTDDERMLAETARRFCEDKLMPRVRDNFRNETFDRSIMADMGAMGFLGSTIPEEYGGAGLSYAGYGLIAREVERIDSGYRSALTFSQDLVMYPIYAYGSDAQRRTYLPRLASGKSIGAFGLTEPDHGSDPGGIRRRARPQCPAVTVSPAPRHGSPIRPSPIS